MTYNLVRFAIKYRYALAIAAALVALYSAYAYAKGVGRDECKQAHEKALFEAQQKAQFEIRKVQQDYAVRKSLLPSQDSGFGVGPVTRMAIDGLPDGRGR